MSQLSVVTSPVVNVVVTSSVTSFSSEKHFQKDLTVAALKASCGCSQATLLRAIYESVLTD